MLRLNFESAAPPHELARDEAMLQWADRVVENAVVRSGDGGNRGLHEREEQAEAGTDTALFRVWRFRSPTVILGRSSRIDEEVDRVWCARQGMDVLRRCTGGASVVGGPGCLMYSVVVGVPSSGGLRNIDAAHDYVMQRVLGAVRRQLPDAERLGICDLTWRGRKFSGNSLRVARHHLLYHGTILIDADLDRIAKSLTYAPRQPEYRRGRDHRSFICNVDLDEARLVQALAEEFGVRGESAGLEDTIAGIAAELWESRYRDPGWHERR
ncbi:lipoate--protein ligase family protein [Allorhodopirellula solitaria]|uniref:Lipoate-protein ligase LplJ n=1 Tax=Allorhodopirellula solitaria TaxID=2527987 RepID=A0A5C5YD16_9BACT|nr:lipoate--protein ligase family protein [Allorhodopirellula solitaria]TWT72984.1 Lipoate-protein ligase LplJ [Allorhodopirellula solitaria]